MDLISVLREVNAWPVEDRMKLVHEVWDQLVDQGFETDLSEDLKAELDRRLAADDAAPEDVVSWDEVKAEALKRAQS
jgi:putative addiction module component (TIGR02574 family)